MVFVKSGAALLVVVLGCSSARAAEASFRCEGVNQTTGAQMQPFTVEIRNKTVTLDGVPELAKSFSLIQQDAHFLVFKNGSKTQGGNIDRSSMTINLYVLDMGKHKLAVQIGGRCSAQ
jgi:hypothetical protein